MSSFNPLVTDELSAKIYEFFKCRGYYISTSRGGAQYARPITYRLWQPVLNVVVIFTIASCDIAGLLTLPHEVSDRRLYTGWGKQWAYWDKNESKILETDRVEDFLCYATDEAGIEFELPFFRGSLLIRDQPGFLCLQRLDRSSFKVETLTKLDDVQVQDVWRSYLFGKITLPMLLEFLAEKDEKFQLCVDRLQEVWAENE